MIYRKTPQRPARMLLKVAAVSTLAAAGACGGAVDDRGLHGTVANCQPGDVCEHGDAGMTGVTDGGNPCAQGCGLVPSTYDAGDEDASTTDDAGTLGVVVDADGGEDDAAVVVGVVPQR